MKQLLGITSDERAHTLTLSFPSRVISTNTDTLRGELDAFWPTPLAQLNTKWEKLELDFKLTSFVDSIGLNLIFDIVKLAEDRKAPVTAILRSRAVRLTFYTVRLDKKMDIKLIESPEPEGKEEVE